MNGFSANAQKQVLQKSETKKRGQGEKRSEKEEVKCGMDGHGL